MCSSGGRRHSSRELGWLRQDETASPSERPADGWTGYQTGACGVAIVLLAAVAAVIGLTAVVIAESTAPGVLAWPSGVWWRSSSPSASG